MPKPSLPPELWTIIIESLPREDQRSCLRVSILLHDIALPFLFSHLTIYFGLWQLRFGKLDQTSHPDHPEMERLNNRTIDMLLHIIRNRDFAGLVKTVSVRAYGPEHCEGIFELRCFAAALQEMPNVRSFHWYGSNPLPKLLLLDALGRASGSKLTDLRISGLAGDVDETASAINCLQTLRLLVDETSSKSDLTAQFIQKTIENNATTLTRLSVHGDAIWGCSIRSLLNLTELELIYCDSLGGIALVFRHCTALHSLVVLAPEISCIDGLVAAFDSDPSALPGLTALKVLWRGNGWDQAPSKKVYDAMARFLENKKRLRMFDLSWYPMYHRSLHDAIENIPSLQCLGVESCYDIAGPANVRTLDEHIPLQISALLIVVRMPHMYPCQWDWIELFAKRRSLGYLHILDFTLDGDMDLKQQLLEDHPLSLRLFGYGPHLRWIVREPQQPEAPPQYSPSWPLATVAHRTVEDFGCADWEWLLRYHDYEEFQMLAPAPLV